MPHLSCTHLLNKKYIISPEDISSSLLNIMLIYLVGSVTVNIRDVKFIAVFAEKSGTEAPMNITSDSAPEHFCIHLVQQGLSVLYILRFGQEMFEFC